MTTETKEDGGEEDIDIFDMPVLKNQPSENGQEKAKEEPREMEAGEQV
jgi:hypothetical protein